MDVFDEFVEQVHEASIPHYMTTKAELVEYYQDLQAVGKVRSWKQAIVHDLAAITGQKPKNLERRFDPSRLNAKVSPRNQAQYEELGRRLPPTYSPPPGGYTVTFAGSILIAGEYCEFRSFTVPVTGGDAMSLATEPQWSTIFDIYFQMSLADDLCGEATVNVQPASTFF